MAARQYYVLLGNFGSGKTELALNFALRSAQEGLDTTLVDLDMINTYFRAADRERLLAEQGVKLIAPRFALANVELITIDPRIYAAFAGSDGVAVFDVGGDNVGARALGQYQAYFQRIPTENRHVWMVVNAFRPLSDSAERILSLKEKIESEARLSVAALINNSNLAGETTGQELLQGYHIVKAAAEASGLPVLYTSGEDAALGEFLALAEEQCLDPRYIGQALPIATALHRDWARFSQFGV